VYLSGTGRRMARTQSWPIEDRQMMNEGATRILVYLSRSTASTRNAKDLEYMNPRLASMEQVYAIVERVGTSSTASSATRSLSAFVIGVLGSKRKPNGISTAMMVPTPVIAATVENPSL
jgi:hypothetical protein